MAIENKLGFPHVLYLGVSCNNSNINIVEGDRREGGNSSGGGDGVLWWLSGGLLLVAYDSRHLSFDPAFPPQGTVCCCCC